MSGEEVMSLVIDNGSYRIRAGYGGDDAPRTVFPSIIGKPKLKVDTKLYIGDEAESKRGTLQINHPIQHGIITNWDDMEKIWHHTLHNELRVAPEDYHVLLTEVPLNSKENREKTTQIMFEKFSIPGMYLANQSVLSLYATGETTGMTVDIGDETTYSVPVYEGHILTKACFKLGISGKDITDKLMVMLSQRKEIEYNFKEYNDSDYKIATDIKEKLCYVSLNFDEEMKSSENVEAFELPDGKKIKIGIERFRCTEVLFQPSLFGFGSHHLPSTINNSFINTDLNIRKDLYKNIILSGGSTMLRGLDKRLKFELEHLIGKEIKVKAPTERNYLVWIGGSIFSSLSSFQSNCISKKEYEESGPSIVHKKCN